jgi:hypothetical protein
MLDLDNDLIFNEESKVNDEIDDYISNRIIETKPANKTKNNAADSNSYTVIVGPENRKQVMKNLRNISVFSKEDMEGVEEALAAYMEGVSNEIVSNAGRISNMRELTSVYIAIMSLRQRLIEDKHIMFRAMADLSDTIRKTKAIELNKIKSNLQLRLKTKDEIITSMDGSMADLLNKEFIMDKFVDFTAESIKTIDSIAYNIKTIVDLDNQFNLVKK